MAKNLRNVFHTYMDRPMAGSKLRSQGCTPAWSAELSFLVTFGTRIRTRIWDQASAWRNKFRPIIILRAHLHKSVFHQHAPATPPYPRIVRTHHHWIWNGYILWGPNHVHLRHSGSQKDIFLCIKQGLDRYWTDIGIFQETYQSPNIITNVHFTANQQFKIKSHCNHLLNNLGLC